MSDWIFFIWAILLAFAGLVSVFGEFLGNIVRNGDVNVTFIVVPIQGNPTV